MVTILFKKNANLLPTDFVKQDKFTWGGGGECFITPFLDRLCLRKWIFIGYAVANEYLSGQTINKSILSWTGLHGNLTSHEVFDLLYKGTLSIKKDKLHPRRNITKRFLLPHGNCQAFEGIPPSMLSIHLDNNNLTASKHEVFIADPSASTRFQLPLMDGDQIIYKNVGNNLGGWVLHNIQIEENVNQVGDGSCTLYPTSQFQSYTDCVDAEMKEWILPALGCLAPWISDEQACNMKIQRNPEHRQVVEWLFKISQGSWGKILYNSQACPLPCTSMSISSKFCLSKVSVFGGNEIQLQFSSSIKVMTIKLSYDFGDLLVEVLSRHFAKFRMFWQIFYKFSIILYFQAYLNMLNRITNISGWELFGTVAGSLCGWNLWNRYDDSDSDDVMLCYVMLC